MSELKFDEDGNVHFKFLGEERRFVTCQDTSYYWEFHPDDGDTQFWLNVLEEEEEEETDEVDEDGNPITETVKTVTGYNLIFEVNGHQAYETDDCTQLADAIKQMEQYLLPFAKALSSLMKGSSSSTSSDTEVWTKLLTP